MDWIGALFSVGLGFLVRLAIPIGLTGLMIWFLHKLDRHWQVDSEPLLAKAHARNAGCWNSKDCPPEVRSECPAFSNPDIACWQAIRQERGYLPAVCLECQVFRQATAPEVLQA